MSDDGNASGLNDYGNHDHDYGSHEQPQGHPNHHDGGNSDHQHNNRDHQNHQPRPHQDFNDYPDDLDFQDHSRDHSQSQGSESASAPESQENTHSTYMDNVVSSQPKLGYFSPDSYDGYDQEIYEKKEKYFLNSEENIETKHEDDCCDRCLLNLVECLMFLV